MKKVLAAIRNIFALLGILAPTVDRLHLALPNVEGLGRLDAKLDKLLGNYTRITQLRIDVEAMLARSDLAPDVRSLLDRIRFGLAAVTP